MRNSLWLTHELRAKLFHKLSMKFHRKSNVVCGVFYDVKGCEVKLNLLYEHIGEHLAKLFLNLPCYHMIGSCQKKRLRFSWNDNWYQKVQKSFCHLH